MNIAIIPARGGSKRIPNKNIKDFLGKPIIVYSIESAIQSNLFDKVIVSTDSIEIAQIAKNYGAEVPFMRPKELSDDWTPTEPVFTHAINWVQDNIGTVNNACCIYSTAPFIRIEDLKKGLENILSEDCNASFPITTFDFCIHRGLKLEENTVKMIWAENELVRSQDLPEAYHDAGMFYWVDVQEYLKIKKIHTNKTKPIIIPRILCQDIDTIEDWKTAEIIYEVSKKSRLIEPIAKV